MFMKQGDVLCWDISHIMGFLREQPNKQLLISRAQRSCNHGYLPMDQTLDLMWQGLVDDWICYSINSFQDVIIAEFDVRRLNTHEVSWCNMHQRARHELWLLTRSMANKYAGTIVNYARVGGVIYLYAQTN